MPKNLRETLAKNELKEGQPKALDLYNKKAQDISPTLTEPHHNTLRCFEGKRIRRLTPIECARLQGFPDNWHEGVSDSQAYKCYGNAVTVAMVTLIAMRLKDE